MQKLVIDAQIERWPLANAFVISRGAKREAEVVVAQVSDGVYTGRGECVPYPRYGQTPEATLRAIKAAPADLDRDLLQDWPADAARNALDCALWDLEAKRTGRRAAEIAGLAPLKPVLTCYTLSLDTPEAMATAARAVPHLPLLKLKLGRPGDAERMRAVRDARPDARLVADANEGWQSSDLAHLLSVAAETGFELIEQPLPADDDAELARVHRPVPVCADESAHTTDDLAALRDRYDAVNIKLDKTGGLTEALRMAREARRLGFRIMTGCMVATSLAMAPALLVAQLADWVDLDGPLLLARDREWGLEIRDGMISPPDPRLWG
ncbi:MAG: dipeptide epimerase [Pseudomonadota bacterium]|jgi:L-alanine-DL-glutamate epimerase-like enolase superfamily enzyme|nr:MAG: dipeptide epimerase [Pseudomonadota bacterium]